MSVLASDDFNRSDSSDLGTVWDVVSGTSNAQILSNRATTTTDNADHAEIYNGVSWPDDQWAAITVHSISSVSRVAAGVRWSGSAVTGYIAECSPSQITLYRAVSGSWTSLGSYSGTVSGGDVVLLEASGSSLTVKQNGTTRITATDSSISSGAAGIYLWRAAGEPANTHGIDAWEAGDFDTGGGGGGGGALAVHRKEPALRPRPFAPGLAR